MSSWKPANLTNVYSQFGEDSILQHAIEVISKIEPIRRYCVEFGAWNGLHFSNTANLIKNCDWSGLLIESNKKRYLELLSNFPEDRVIKVNEFVHFEGDFLLENILDKYQIPIDFDLLSIDIDGNDYWILNSISKYKPKIIVIEFNPTIPNKIHFVNEKNVLISQGSSIKALVELGESKGYFPLASTACNLILIDTKYERIFPERPETIDELHTEKYTTQIWIGFNGELFLSNDLPLLWHSLTYSQRDVQVIPKFLREFPENYSKLQTIALKVFRKYSYLVRKK